MSQHPYDFIDRSRVSNCCGAPIIGTDICSDCKEHCDVEPEDGPDEPNYDAPKPLAPLENWLRNDERNVP